MRPARTPKWTIPGMRPRSEFAPDDLVRSIERRRTRFIAEVMIDPDAWTIAKAIAKDLRGSHGEGLRGIFVPSPEGEGTGHVYWWTARRASHHEGRLLLRLNPDRSDPGLLEVEVNVDRDTTLYYQFGMRQDDMAASTLVTAFLAHPSVGQLIDGCISRNGRLVLIDVDGRIRLSTKVPDNDPHEEIDGLRRAAWEAMQERARRWSRSRRRTDEHGHPMPDRGPIASFRRWMDAEGWILHRQPIPSISVEEGRIVLTWRGSDLRGIIVFEGVTMSSRTVMRGEWSEHGPVDVSTDHRMRTNGLRIPDMHGMRDHDAAAMTATAAIHGRD